ncbi:MAG: hypothetical protein MSG64_15790 [Pyrinomonadaceae bacterium MAG19_C2-C3]|nr:hypothetical protein [Pyrinomonadaceae bacterium MAG19_C2-C3]
MRAVFIHTSIYTSRTYSSNEWRVFEGLLLKSSDPLDLPAEIMFVDDEGAIRIAREKHLSRQCGAAFWVFANEFDLLAQNVEADWHRRGCWRESYDDVQHIKTEREGKR